MAERPRGVLGERVAVPLAVGGAHEGRHDLKVPVRDVGSLAPEVGEPDALERRRLELAEERDRALAALKELEFDHRTGKVSDEDYRASVGPMRRRAAEALRALEPRSGTGADAEAQTGAKIHAGH